MNKIYRIVSAATLAISSLFIAGSVLAAVTINKVSLNGSDNISADAGAQIAATVNVSITSPSVWRSTAYKIGDGIWNCVDTPDHSGDTNATETFLINAPATQGTDNINFAVYGNNDCTNSLGAMVVSASLLSSVLNVFSYTTYGTWTSLLLLALVVIIAVVVISSIVKKNRNKKSDIIA